MNFKVINNILSEFNLAHIQDKSIEYPELDLKTSLSREFKRLMDNRNHLAHGGNTITINREDLNRAIKLVEILMDLVFERIMEGFNNRTYLHTP